MKGIPITEQLYTYIIDTFAPDDVLLRSLPAEAARLGLPLIQISPEQGKFLQVLIKAVQARKVIEIGALFGYSTIWMARALPAGGKITSLELNPQHVQVTRQNAARAGLADKIEIREGNAVKLLDSLKPEAPFDMAFIDGVKAEYTEYLDKCLKLVRPGGLIVADNNSAHGRVWETDPPDEVEYIQAIRAFNQRMASDPHLTSVLVPISDGMCVGVVNA